jgi:hypothetical protein
MPLSSGYTKVMGSHCVVRQNSTFELTGKTNISNIKVPVIWPARVEINAIIPILKADFWVFMLCMNPEAIFDAGEAKMAKPTS